MEAVTRIKELEIDEMVREFGAMPTALAIGLRKLTFSELGELYVYIREGQMSAHSKGVDYARKERRKGHLRVID